MKIKTCSHYPIVFKGMGGEEITKEESIDKKQDKEKKPECRVLGH